MNPAKRRRSGGIHIPKGPLIKLPVPNDNALPTLNSTSNKLQCSKSLVLKKGPISKQIFPTINISDNSPEMNYNLGLLHLQSHPDISLEYLRQAAEKQHSNAMYQYARLLMKDPTKKSQAFSEMKAAAKLGQRDAIFEYGKMLETGFGCPVNREAAYLAYQKGIKHGDGNSMFHCAKLLKDAHIKPREMYELFKEAADLDVPGAFFELAICLRDGTGVSIDAVCAARIFKQLADQNDPAGTLEYALCLKDGIGVQPNIDEFRKTMEKAISYNHIESKLTYAKMLEVGYGYDQNVAEAESIYRELSNQGNPFAHYYLALLLQNQGKYEEAIKYYKLANEQHHLKALFSLAMLQIQIPEMKAEGMANLKAAADMGNARAQFDYAIYLEKEKNYDINEVLKYYKLASDAGLPNAMCNYASHLKEADYKAAIALFKKAADKGHCISMYSYALFIKKSKIDEALQYFEMAAEKNHAKSQYQLGMIKLGYKDIDSAFALMKKSADSGYRKAIDQYNTMTTVVPGITDDPERNIDIAFEYLRHFAEHDKALEIYQRYHIPESVLSQLRLYQLQLLNSNDANVTKAILAKIMEMAKGGYVEAKYVYASILEEGKFTKKNMLEARKYYQEGCKVEHALSMSAYGRILKVEDQALATKLFKGAADKGLPIAQYQYAKMLEIAGTFDEALKYYEFAADTGLAKAQYRCAHLLQTHYESELTYKTAAQLYQYAARQNHSKAINNYATLLERGMGINRNRKLAALLYHKASQLGNIIATHNYARILEHGIGVEKDASKAAQIYKQLAQTETNGLAQYHYGRMCHNGIGVNEDYEEAKKYYLKAIDNNIVEAKQNYGVLLFTKFHKWNEATRYFEMAVSGNGGRDSAKFNYAQLLLQGIGVEKDSEMAEILLRQAASTFLPAMVAYAQMIEGTDAEKAALYYKKAANKKDHKHLYLHPQRNAQYQLALMYRDGRGVETNNTLFMKYIKMAAKNNHPDAEAVLHPPTYNLDQLL